ncbi:ABC transporter permease [Alsobacter metallidurans]|uniref:ABC transporter permease n=1 Tax=Alsobacter metallidurans TaxID=340221 RepID=A0A917MG86_9HYPH|nr:ABC transporter permease [Alsobacter metallidurans]GGH08662.1 ABC transporter permease [Alsobacter metallidurans]
MSAAPIELPRWADYVLVPALAVAAAFVIAGLVVLAIGENPLESTAILLRGALATGEGVGFTLYYATNFIFTGLAVAVAFHAGLFNIGGEGQATLGGLGAALVCLQFESLPGWLLVPLGALSAAAFGALWALVPGYLQAKRGSHIVITTIMFNMLASALLVYLLVNVMGRPGSMSPETRTFVPAAHVPFLHEILARFGVVIPTTPLNGSFVLALAAAFGVWLLIWRTRLGYAIRTVGANPSAAVYAGISISRITMIAMMISGGLAGLLAVNEIMGVQDRLLLEFTGGYGFIGIAVALMGRSHPVGIVLASLLFGVLYQGGTELAFDKPAITRDMIVTISGLVILFAGALDGVFRAPLGRFFASRRRGDA